MALLGVAALLYFLAWPVSVEPAAHQVSSAPPLEGLYATNDRLANAKTLRTPAGPEDVAIGPDGCLYTGVADGRILRVDSELTRFGEFAQTGGRPLGLAFDGAGRLLVADARRGLLAIDSTRAVSVLAQEAGGLPIQMADELAIAPDGSVWFTDASQRHNVDDAQIDALENQPTGRILRYAPDTGATTVVLDGLRYANGIAIGGDAEGTYVLFSETFAYRVSRLRIDGPRDGLLEIVADNLPGFVDNITLGADGILWVALVSRRSGLLDATLPYPFVRKMMARIPRALVPVPPPYGFVLGLDRDGAVTHNLQDPSGVIGEITSATPVDDRLVLGSVNAEQIAAIPRPGAVPTTLRSAGSCDLQGG